MAQSKQDKRRAAEQRAEKYVPNPAAFGLRQKIKAGKLSRDQVRGLVEDTELSSTFRAWARRWLQRNQTVPTGKSPEGNRAELDAPSPHGGEKKRRSRKKAKVSKRTSR
jgi:hypothetical protein